MTRIRLATSLDRDDIRGIHLAAFPDKEREPIARLALALLDWPGSPPSLSLVADNAGEVVGHVAFSPVGIDHEAAWRGYILAPLAVMPAHHGKGIGSGLVDRGIRQLADTGADVLFVYGDPDYYGRFGFEAAIASAYPPPYALDYPFGWQAMVLNPRDLPSAQGTIRCIEPLNDPMLW